MKIVMINTVCGIGSTGRIVADLARQLNKDGHETYIAYGRGSAPNDLNTYRVGSDCDMYIHALKSRISDRQGFYSTKATGKLVSWIKMINPDVIHLHNLHGYYLDIKMLFEELKKMDVRVIWTLHDCWTFTGHCAHFDYEGCDRWRTGCYDCPLKGEYPASWLMDASSKNYTEKKALFTGLKDMTIVTPSNWLADLVRQSYLNEYPVEVVHNGIDLDIFKPTKGNFRELYNLKDKKIVLGVSGIWNDRKGLSDFIELSKKLPDVYRVVLVGVSKKQYKELGDEIIAITHTDSAQQLAEIYTTADVFVNTTLEDTYPTVNLEAQACGTPVITYRTGGSPESVPDENVVGKQDVTALMGKILVCDELSCNSVKSNSEMLKEYVFLINGKKM